MIRIATVNVNGLRAALRKGMREWLEPRGVDVLALQEVRAPDEIVRNEFDDWAQVHAEAEQKGRAGVAILSRREPLAARTGVGEDYFATSGRWVEMDLEAPALASGRLTLISAYVHTGEVDTPKQVDKYRFMTAMERRMNQLREEGRSLLVVGDVNICHREQDLKNWRNNMKRSGFLADERAWVGSLFEQHGFVDVQRQFAGDVEGPYSWWTWRGQAFDRDVGWRIDYHIATPDVAERVVNVVTDRAPSYAERWSDHSPVVADYDLG